MSEECAVNSFRLDLVARAGFRDVRAEVRQLPRETATYVLARR